MLNSVATYEQKIEELKAIINQLENETLSLEQSMQLFSRGTQLHEEAEKILKEAETVCLQIYGEREQDE